MAEKKKPQTKQTIMNRVQGKQSAFAPIKQDASRIIISYGFNAVENSDTAIWREIYLYKKQQNNLTLADVKEAIIADINVRVKTAIVSGFKWQDKPVWISEENQLNFSQAVAPVTLKIGEQEDGTPVYQEFATKNDLKAFNDAWQAYRQQCLTDGWAEKDGIEWTPYEAMFPTDTEE